MVLDKAAHWQKGVISSTKLLLRLSQSSSIGEREADVVGFVSALVGGLILGC